MMEQRSINPLGSTPVLEGQVRHVEHRIPSPAVQQSLGFRVDTRVNVGPQITDGVASAEHQQTAAMMFKKKSQKEQSKKKNDPDFRKKVKRIVATVTCTVCLVTVLLFMIIGVDPNTAEKTAGRAENVTTDSPITTSKSEVSPEGSPEGSPRSTPDPTLETAVTWVFRGGDTTSNHRGDYEGPGQQWPGARSSVTMWVVHHSRYTEMFMFGGVGCDRESGGLGSCGSFLSSTSLDTPNPAVGDGRGYYLNDAWRYDGLNFLWCGGSQIGGVRAYSHDDRFDMDSSEGWLLDCSNGVGQCGWPAVRASGAAWIAPGDGVDDMWLFGGETYDGGRDSTVKFLNDLWKIPIDTLREPWDGRSRKEWRLAPFCMSPSSVSAPCQRYNTVDANDRGFYQLDALSTWPSARGGSAVFSNSDPMRPGQTFLFGGWGIKFTAGADATVGYNNELWRFDYEYAFERDGTRGGHTVFELIGHYSANNLEYIIGGPVPSGRCHPVLWQNCERDTMRVCEAGIVYIYGGKSANGIEADLWKLDVSRIPRERSWRNLTIGQPLYSNREIADSRAQLEADANHGANPGSRYDATGWPQDDGSLWMYGGLGYVGSGATPNFLRGLWHYEPSRNTWNWEGERPASGVGGQYLGSELFPGARFRSTSWVGRDGTKYLFGGLGCAEEGHPCGQLNDLWTLNV